MIALDSIAADLKPSGSFADGADAYRALHDAKFKGLPIYDMELQPGATQNKQEGISREAQH